MGDTNVTNSVAETQGTRSRPVGDSAYSDAQLLLAARLYYIDDIVQSQIAKMVGVSQAKVSRMLAAARERGLVQISVPEFEPRDAELERQLCRRFKLDRAVVVRQLAGQAIADLRNTLGYFAAPVVAQWLAPNGTVAVAGGRTLQCLVDAMCQLPAPGPLTVTQAMGNVDATPGAYDASEIGRRLSRHWGSVFLALNAPALLPDREVAKQLLGLKNVRDVFDRLAAADVALVGVGTLENSVFLDRRIVSSRDLDMLRRAGAVGEILGRYYDARGRECATPLRERMASLPLDKLRRVANVVGVVAGSDRAEAIRAAIAGGLLKGLVIDDAAARQLLEGAAK
jgi:deoxyribonucleoside regulator